MQSEHKLHTERVDALTTALSRRSFACEYWSQVDHQLVLNMDVLDDFQGEARKYPRVTYGEPLHRMREFGVHVKEIDFLDEKKCELEQIRLLCATVFGGRQEDFPHPEVDMAGFKSTIERLNSTNPQVYSPAGSGRRRAWVDLAKVRSPKKKSGCVIC